MLELNKIHQGDCLELMKQIPDESIDAIITDPPYELGFMGKSWDSTGIANNVDMWKECFRILKSGGHILAFSGTRTYHRMASAIEDADFEVRDMIEWVYGSGFPKSLNIGKAVDKILGNEREVIGDSWDMPDLRDVGKKSKESCGIDKLSFGQVQDAERKKIKLTKGNSEWEGWGTALKPAHEPICMARKPLSEKTVAENCLKWGTGGINIDESRVGTEKLFNSFAGNKNTGFTPNDNRTDSSKGLFSGNKKGITIVNCRFPANLIHDGSEEVLKEFEKAGISGNGNFKQGCIRTSKENIYELGFKKKDIQLANAPDNYGDIGTPARFFKTCEFTEQDFEYAPFFYSAKASKSERNNGCDELEEKRSSAYGYDKGLGNAGEGMFKDRNPIKQNNHPTVKPTALMEYLIKMITKENQIVLDPFIGSGTTAVACKKLNRNFIGIEKEEEYCKIANKRLSQETLFNYENQNNQSNLKET